MKHTDDAYAAMLLTLALSPNKEEYARPFSVPEFRRFEEAVRASQFRGIGSLLKMDISGFMIHLGLSEEDSYRAYTLLHRDTQLSFALDGYMQEGVDIVTQYDAEYPKRPVKRLGEAAPPCFYLCGDEKLLNQPAIAIMGISGVKTTAEVRDAIETLVRGAIEKGYAIITGGEMGVSRVAESMTAKHGGILLDILGGDMHERLKDDTVARLVAEKRGVVASLEHPDAMFTVSHAIARNKLILSLADAAFIFSTDGRRGESDALQNRICDWVYAWEGNPACRTLIARGAQPLRDLRALDFDVLYRHWEGSRSEQVNIFDLLAKKEEEEEGEEGEE